MPKFNLSPDDATKLVNYFASRDGSGRPYEFDARRQSEHLAFRTGQIQRAAEEAGEPEKNRDRFEASVKTITNRTYCVQCTAWPISNR